MPQGFVDTIPNTHGTISFDFQNAEQEKHNPTTSGTALKAAN